MRGVERIFGTVRQTLARWIQEKAAKLPAMEATLLAAEPDDVLELDELWSFVRTKRNQRWVWIALCRRTRQVVACFIGDRSADSPGFAQLIPQSYSSCCSCSDFWEAYQLAFDVATQRRKQEKPPRTLEQHPATTFGPLCAQDPGFFQVRPLSQRGLEVIHP